MRERHRRLTADRPQLMDCAFLACVALLPALPGVGGLAFGYSYSAGSILNARLFIRPEQVVLLLLALMLLFRPGSAVRIGDSRLSRAWVWLMVACVLWIVLANTVLRAPSLDALRSIKNYAIPALLGFFVVKAFIRNPNDLGKVMACLSIGMAVGIAAVLVRVDPTAQEVVRQIETEGLHYTWLGLVSGICFCLSLLYFFRSRPVWKAVFVACACVSLAGTYVAANRAVIYALIAGPLILLALHFLRPAAVVGIGVCAMVLCISVICCPDAVTGLLPAGANDAVKGLDRVIPDPVVVLGSLKGRLSEWDAMLCDRSAWGFICGMDYGAAMARASVFSHPHNIFLWMHLQGGLVAGLLFAAALACCWWPPLVAARTSPDQSQRWLARLCMLGHVMIFLVLVSNSWNGGATAILVGFWAAISFSFTGSAARVADIPRPLTPLREAGQFQAAAI